MIKKRRKFITLGIFLPILLLLVTLVPIKISIESLFIPGWITSIIIVISGLIKIYEYHDAYDFTVWISIVSRFIIGALYLTSKGTITPDPYTPEFILLRFAATMLFLAEDMRQVFKLVGRRYKRS